MYIFYKHKRLFLSIKFAFLVFFIFRGIAVQRYQAAEAVAFSAYLPITMRREASLHSAGPEGGSIVVMVTDPSNPSTLYAGTWGGGMYKSVNSGQTWFGISEGLNNLYINSLDIDPQNPAILYAGTYASGVYKTTNAGATWFATGPGLSEKPIVYTIAVDPVMPNVVYVGTRNQQDGPPWGGGLYKTTNGGDTWKKSRVGISEDWIYDIKIDPTDHNILYAATHSVGVYKSTSAGSYWVEMSHGITDLSTRSIVIDPTNSEILYVGTWHYGGVFKSENGGKLWTRSSNGLNHKIYSLNMDPKHPHIIYAATYRKGIMMTENGAASWHGAGLYPDMVYNVMVDRSNTSILYAGTMGDGFYKSFNKGDSWGRSNSGLKTTNITGLAVAWPVAEGEDFPVAYAAVYGSGIYKTADLGQTWEQVSNGLGELWVNSLAMSRTDPLTLYAGTDSTGVYITQDGGLTWTDSSRGLPEPALAESSFDGWVNPSLRPDLFDRAFFEGDPDLVATVEKVVSILAITEDSFEPEKFYLGTDGLGIYLSENGGENWAPTSSKTHKVYSILSDPFTTDILYAGCDYTTDTLLKSLDGGQTWKTSNVGMPYLTVYALAADPGTPGVLYAGTSMGVYKSTDSAKNWEFLGMYGNEVYSLAKSPSTPGLIYAGANVGLSISKDDGLTWQLNNTGLVNKEITQILLDPAETHPINLFGTRAGGVILEGYETPKAR